MIHAQDIKFISVTPPAAAVDTGSYTTAEIDTLGYNYLTVVAYMGALEDAFTALKVGESATSGGSLTDVAVFGTTNDIDGSTSALPTATDDNKFFVMQIDLRGRERYFDVTATVADASGDSGNFCTIFAMLSKAKESAYTAAGIGSGGAISIPVRS